MKCNNKEIRPVAQNIDNYIQRIKLVGWLLLMYGMNTYGVANALKFGCHITRHLMTRRDTLLSMSGRCLIIMTSYKGTDTRARN